MAKTSKIDGLELYQIIKKLKKLGISIDEWLANCDSKTPDEIRAHNRKLIELAEDDAKN